MQGVHQANVSTYATGAALPARNVQLKHRASVVLVLTHDGRAEKLCITQATLAMHSVQTINKLWCIVYPHTCVCTLYSSVITCYMRSINTNLLLPCDTLHIQSCHCVLSDLHYLTQCDHSGKKIREHAAIAPAV
jgi:hypothetical protein